MKENSQTMSSTKDKFKEHATRVDQNSDDVKITDGMGGLTPERLEKIRVDKINTELRYTTPGDHIILFDQEFSIESTGIEMIETVRDGTKRIRTRLGLFTTNTNNAYQLYIDRNPCLLNECNGGIWEAPPDKIRILER